MAKRLVKILFPVTYDDANWRPEQTVEKMAELLKVELELGLRAAFQGGPFDVEEIGTPEILSLEGDPMPYVNAAVMVEMVEEAAKDQTRIAKTGGRSTDFVRALELTTMAKYMRDRLEYSKKFATDIKKPSLREKVSLTPDQPMNATVSSVLDATRDVEHLLTAKGTVIMARLRDLLSDAIQASNRRDDIRSGGLVVELEKIIAILEKP